jgi:hypothetical protein
MHTAAAIFKVNKEKKEMDQHIDFAVPARVVTTERDHACETLKAKVTQ